MRPDLWGSRGDTPNAPPPATGFAVALNRASLPPVTIAPAAFASLMIESGEDLGMVSRILGHADFATTADVYAHLTPACWTAQQPEWTALLTG